MVERKWWVEVSVETRRRIQLPLASLWLCKKWVVEHLGLREEFSDWHLAI